MALKQEIKLQSTLDCLKQLTDSLGKSLENMKIVEIPRNEPLI